MTLRQYLADWLKSTEPPTCTIATTSTTGDQPGDPASSSTTINGTNADGNHRRQTSQGSTIVNIEAVQAIIFNSTHQRLDGAEGSDGAPTDIEEENSPRSPKSQQPPPSNLKQTPTDLERASTEADPGNGDTLYDLMKVVIETDEVKDFLEVVSRRHTFSGEVVMPSADENDSSPEPPTPDDGPPISELADRNNEVLQAFQDYWQDQVDSLGPQPKIEIRLINASAKVKALKPREDGRLPNMWEPITRQCNLLIGEKSYCRQVIFDNLNARFQPGKMTLLLGAPGTGKSTLLKMIAGRLENDDHWKTSGVYINEQPLKKSRVHPARVIALVDEADVHIPTMTVEDTLLFAYKCNSKMGKESHVQTIMKTLGLTHVAKAVIGDENIRGISGGEKRRVTVGEQWAANVRVFLADRLTDGLDSQAALDLIKALRVWSYTTEATVVLSLLQPPPEAYKYFDDVCILQSTPGQNVLYCGPIREAGSILGAVGYESTNLNQPQKLLTDIVEKRKMRPSLNGLVQWRREKQKTDSGYRRSYMKHLKLCIRRQATLEFSNRGLIISRVLLNLGNGLATASIYATSGNENYTLEIKSALIFHMCMSAVLSVISHIGLFLQDRPVFYRQRGAYFFRASNYWIAHNFFQLVCWALLESLLLSAPVYWLTGLQKSFPKYLIFWMALYLLNLCSSLIFKILAIVCNTTEMSQTFAGVVQVVFFLFSGYLQRWHTVPAGWIWARWFSPQSYAFIILLVNEFEGTVYTCSDEELVRYEGICPYTSGTDYIRDEYDVVGYSNAMGPLFMGLIAWYIIYAIVGAICLHFVKWRPVKLHRIKPYRPSSAERHLLLPVPVVLSWKNIKYTVTSKSGCCREQVEKVLLHDVQGMVQPESITALMGPSGAGKTTMLDVIAGRKTGGKIEGDILVNGHAKDQHSFTRISGYVEQMNCMTEALTVMEALKFSAKFRLPGSIEMTQRVAFIETVAEMLELTAVVHERIMDILVDQKKRCAVAMEVVAQPSVLFLDEPTTGLDSLGAHMLLRALHRLKNEMKMAIVCTIHQPSKDLFFKFDRLVLMSKGGRMVYTGELGTKATTFISYLDSIEGVRQLKLGENPASWMLEQIGGGIQPDYSVVDKVIAAWKTSEPCRILEEEFAAQQPGDQITIQGDYVIPQTEQLRYLIDRCFRIYWRSDSYNLVRSSLVVVLALLFGTVYWRMDYTQATVWTRLSFCYTSSFYVGLTFLLSGVTILMPQRAAFYRERASNAYASWAYAVAFFIAELPYVTLNSLLFLCVTWFFAELYWKNDPSQFGLFWQLALPFWGFLYMCTILGHAISAISPSMEVANAIGPGVASWFSSFAGFYLPRPYLPVGYLFIYWLNPFRYAFEALILTEFRNVPISCKGSKFTNSTGGPLCIWKDGNDVIEDMGMLPWGYPLDVCVIFGYMAAFACVALLGLRYLRFGTK